MPRRDGTARDTHIYSILADEWRDVKRHLELRLCGTRQTVEKEAPMQVEVFRGRDRIFAVVEVGGAGKLPERYGPWTQFKTLELTRGQKQPDNMSRNASTNILKSTAST